MAVPMASSAKVVTFGYFWRFQTSRSLVSRGRRVCPNSFCVAGAILLRRFQKMGCIFGYFSWQAQHFTRIVLRVFANHIVGAASRGDSVQIPWLAWHFVTCAEN